MQWLAKVKLPTNLWGVNGGMVLKIFQSPVEIAGQMGALVRGLRQYGHEAVGYNTWFNYLNYTEHITNTDLASVIRAFDEAKKDYDIFHYHLGVTLQSDMSDLVELKGLGRKRVMHHWGNDARLKSLAQKKSPFLLDPCNPLTDEVMDEKLKRLGSLIPTVIIQDFELLDYVKNYYMNIYVLPLAFDVAGTQVSYPNPETKIPLIIHAPTQPSFKGTVFIESTLDLLQKNGFPLRYKRIENMSHTEAMQVYREADIVIDQVLAGTYGTFAVEAMAQGKPVVGYIREDLIDTFPATLPIIQADPVTLYHRLIPYLLDGNLRHSTGIKSREYAQMRHDIMSVMPTLLSIYDVVLNQTI